MLPQVVLMAVYTGGIPGVGGGGYIPQHFGNDPTDSQFHTVTFASSIRYPPSPTNFFLTISTTGSMLPCAVMSIRRNLYCVTCKYEWKNVAMKYTKYVMTEYVTTCRCEYKYVAMGCVQMMGKLWWLGLGQFYKTSFYEVMSGYLIIYHTELQVHVSFNKSLKVQP